MSKDSRYADRLRKEEWVVCNIGIRLGRPLIEELHYSKSAGSVAVAVDGLVYVDEMTIHGAAWWAPPIKNAAVSVWADPNEVLALSRLVVTPGTPKNAATFLLSNSAKRLPKRWRCLLTYADSWQGHTGGIYRAAGWEYLGETRPGRVYVLDGKMVSNKANRGTRSHEEMLALGAEVVASSVKHKFRFVRK